MAKEPSLDVKIKRLMNESMYNPFIFCVAIQMLKDVLDQLGDKEIYQYFGYLFPPSGVRQRVNYLHSKLNEK